MDKSARGATSELLAAADLLRQGYEVFRALSPSASCDLIAMKAGTTYRVQVRTGQRYAPTGKLHCSRAGAYDLLVVVDLKTGELIYDGLELP